jgi:SPP1 gp7 family putative phage head morphogenesis protein
MRQYGKGFRNRMRLLTGTLNRTHRKQWDYQVVDVKFAKNMPVNLVKMVEIVTKLVGQLSHEERLALLPFVDDPRASREKLLDEQDEDPERRMRMLDPDAMEGGEPIYNASRLDQLMTSIKTILHSLRGEEEQQLRITWGEKYKLSIYHHLYFLEQDLKIGVLLPQLTFGMVLAAVERPWQGRHFSKRIRLRTDLLAAAMEDVISQGAIQGWGVTRTAREITNWTSESWSSALRLARTEINRVAAQGQTMAYQVNADIMSEKEFCAILDKRTSFQYRKLDGKRFPLDYDTEENPGREGERIPNHPNCRSYWRPVMKSKVLEKLERERSYRIDQKRDCLSSITES